MKRSSRRLKEARTRLRALADSGALERDLAEAYARELRHLEHALDNLGNVEILKRVDAISRLFLKAQ